MVINHSPAAWTDKQALGRIYYAPALVALLQVQAAARMDPAAPHIKVQWQPTPPANNVIRFGSACHDHPLHALDEQPSVNDVAVI